MTIKLVTLKSNHTLMASVEETDDTLKLKEPVLIVIQQTPNGPGIAFAPFLEYCEEFTSGIDIKKSDVLSTNSPVRELLNNYNKMFGSGIEIATVVPKL